MGGGGWYPGCTWEARPTLTNEESLMLMGALIGGGIGLLIAIVKVIQNSKANKDK